MIFDIKNVVRLVDDFLDDDYHTRDSCPGTIFGKKLIPVAIQRERRIFGKGSIKHLIFKLEGTRELWYKKSYCNAGVVAMGFSLSQMDYDKRSVPMETYAELFLDGDKFVERVGDNSSNWLKRNNFELVVSKFA